MFSRLTSKLHDRMGTPSDEGTAARVLARLRRPAGRLIIRRQGRLRDLERLGRAVSSAPVTPADPPKRVLVASLRAWATHNAYESVFAQALRMRGAEVAMLTCGGGLPMCEVGWSRHAGPFPCDRCGWYTDHVAAASRLPQYRLADDLPWGDDGRRAPHEPPPSSGIDPNWAAELSVPWMLRSADVDGSPRGAEMRRDFAVAASGVATSAERTLEDFRPDAIVLLGGLFAAERVINELALARGIRVITYEMAPRGNALIFSAEGPAAWGEARAAWERCRDQPLTDSQRSAIETMLAERTLGRGAIERYFDDPVTDTERIRASLGIEPGTRVISLFTNLTWDSAVVGRDLAYDSMFDWIADAVETAGELEDTVLIVRVHPGEAKWGTAQPVTERLGDLPTNVRVIGPEEPLSSYALLGLTDLVLAYSTTVGLEAAVRGIPVGVAAMTHYRERGFTYDLRSGDELRGLLRGGRWEMTGEQVELALRYAFMFFFRSMVPVPVVELDEGDPSRLPLDPDELRPGADRYLDFICDRILNGGDFVVPDALATPMDGVPIEDRLPARE